MLCVVQRMVGCCFEHTSKRDLHMTAVVNGLLDEYGMKSDCHHSISCRAPPSLRAWWQVGMCLWAVGRTLWTTNHPPLQLLFR